MSEISIFQLFQFRNPSRMDTEKNIPATLMRERVLNQSIYPLRKRSMRQSISSQDFGYPHELDHKISHFILHFLQIYLLLLDQLPVQINLSLIIIGNPVTRPVNQSQVRLQQGHGLKYTKIIRIHFNFPLILRHQLPHLGKSHEQRVVSFPDPGIQLTHQCRNIHIQTDQHILLLARIYREIPGHIV